MHNLAEEIIRDPSLPIEIDWTAGKRRLTAHLSAEHSNANTDVAVLKVDPVESFPLFP